MKRKEYCYKAVISDDNVLFLGSPFSGLWHVFVANKNIKSFEEAEDPDFSTYSLYGGYKNIGNAEKRLLKSAMAHSDSSVKFYYAEKEMIIKHGAFGNHSENNK